MDMFAVVWISLAAVALLGYWVMGRVDAFLAENAQLPPPKRRPRYLLYFGVDAQDARLRGEDGLWELLETPDIRPDISPKVVAALSEDDLENILLSTQARRRSPGCVTIARLNDPAYVALFRRAHISHVVRGELTARDLLSIVQGGSTSCDFT